MFNGGTDHQTLDHAELDGSAHSKRKNNRNRNKYRRNASHYEHGQDAQSQGFNQPTTHTATQMSATLSEEITEEYLSTSLQPSLRISQPNRKLLVLDLNGTLLYRLRPQSRSRPTYQTYSDASPAPSRLTYSRPYLPSFRQYLFHPVTRGWLDVMVWSSAQPHSVRDMLRLCFPREGGQLTQEAEVKPGPAGREDDRFFAVWARNTLGLSQADYSRKVQTTKNLEKIWTETSSQVPKLSEPPPLLHTSDIILNSESSNSPTELMHAHSPLSTLLLDDSPLKARLQPWNHLCVQEYDEGSWKQNTRIVESWSRSQKVERRVSISISSENNGTDVANIEEVSSITDTLERSEEQNFTGESRTRSKTGSSSEPQENENSGNIAPFPSQTFISSDSHDSIYQQRGSNSIDFLSSPVTTSPTEIAPSSDTFSSLDETLLAAIGILEELKYQSNVCGWLRNRGPWIIDDATGNRAPRVDSVSGETNPITTLHENVTPQSSQSSLSYRDVMSLSSEDIQNMPIPGLSQSNSASQPVAGAHKRPYGEILTGAKLKKERRKRLKLSDGSASVSSSSTLSVTPAQHTRSPPASLDNLKFSPLMETNFSLHSSSPPQFWFQDKDVFAHWVREGRRALRQLDIAEFHGFEAL